MIRDKKYFYKTYGLKIESDIEIREFIELKGKEVRDIDVKIYCSTIPERVKKLKNQGRKSLVVKNEIWFDIKDIASYYITNGDTIIVEPCENHDKELLKVYLMCSCLGFIMLQREMVAIHGGVIDFNGKAMIFTGDRGAGKSTLTTALRQNGYKFLSDDVASVMINNKVPHITHGFPYQKLCQDAMDNMGYDKDKCTTFMSDTQRKYLVPAYGDFTYDNTELFGICKISVGDVEKVIIEECIGSEKMNEIINNIYRGEFIKYLGGMTPKYFKQCIDIAKNIKFYKMIRPKNRFTVNEQVKLIENTVINKKEAMAI